MGFSAAAFGDFLPELFIGPHQFQGTLLDLLLQFLIGFTQGLLETAALFIQSLEFRQLPPQDS